MSTKLVVIIIACMMAALVVISALMSGTEAALIAVNKIRIRHLIEKGVKKARVVHGLISSIDRVITTILISNNLVNTAFCTLGTIVFMLLVGDRIGPFWTTVLATIVMTTVLLVLCEITPKIFSVRHADGVSLFVARPMTLLVKVLAPVSNAFTRLATMIIRLFGGGAFTRSPLMTEEEIKVMISMGREQGVLSDEENKLLHRIFEFGDTRVSEVMVPKENIVSISADADAEELLDLLAEGGHSRIPVYEGNEDNVVGVLYTRDLLYVWRDKGLILLKDLIRPAYCVLPSKKVTELLIEFRRRRMHMAIVVDEQNKVAGLVTLEDLTEEIVGEIPEHSIADAAGK